MKSSFAYSILYNNAEVGDKKGLYITLEHAVSSLKQQMGTLGMVEVKYYLHDLLKRENYDLILNMVNKVWMSFLLMR